MGPLAKLHVCVDEVKSSGKLRQMSLEKLLTAAEQTVVLVGQTLYGRHNVLTSLLRDLTKSTSAIKEHLEALVQKSYRFFGSKFEGHLQKDAKLKNESKKSCFAV